MSVVEIKGRGKVWRRKVKAVSGGNVRVYYQYLVTIPREYSDVIAERPVLLGVRLRAEGDEVTIHVTRAFKVGEHRDRGVVYYGFTIPKEFGEKHLGETVEFTASAYPVKKKRTEESI